MTVATSPICMTCARLWHFPYCDAFGEEQIPQAIITNLADHREPYPGDHDLQYVETKTPLKPWATRPERLRMHGPGTTEYERHKAGDQHWLTEPRRPKGDPAGGEWTSGGGAGSIKGAGSTSEWTGSSEAPDRGAELDKEIETLHADLDKAWDRYREALWAWDKAKGTPEAAGLKERMDKIHAEYKEIADRFYVVQAQRKTVKKGQRVEQLRAQAQEIADERGFKGKIVVATDPGMEYDLGTGVKFHPGGTYTPKTNTITVYAGNISDEFLPKLMAHEIEHSRFDAVEKMRSAELEAIYNAAVPTKELMSADGRLKPPHDKTYPVYSALYDYLDSTGGKYYKELTENTNYVSSYAEDWWNSVKAGKAVPGQAINETLAEIAAAELELYVPGRDVIVGRRWKELYDLVNEIAAHPERYELYDPFKGASEAEAAQPSPAQGAIEQFTGEHDFLSNFHPSPITLSDGITYPTIEHAYQAQKTLNLDERRKVAAAKTPGAAKRLGRRVAMQPGWDGMKDEAMHDLLARKFEDPELRAKLLATGDAHLVEGNTWGDRYWGVSKGRGQNKLGQLLMRVRNELR